MMWPVVGDFAATFMLMLAWKMIAASVIWYEVLGAVAAMFDRKTA